MPSTFFVKQQKTKKEIFVFCFFLIIYLPTI